MNFDCDYNNKSSSRYHHSESCTKLNYVYTSRQCDEYFEYLEELRRIIFGQRYPGEMLSAGTHSMHSNTIHYHTQNGRTLVYNIEDATDYGITLSPIPSETETIVTETFHAEEHVLARPETSQIIPRKLCHQLPSIEERMRNCLHSSSEVINSYLSDSRELFQSTPMPCDDYSLKSHLTEKGQSDYHFQDYCEDDQDFNDLSSLSDGVNASFAVIEDFAKVLEETGSVFEEVDHEGFDDQWSISDDKVRRIVGIVKRHNEHEPWDHEKVSTAEVIECPHPTVHYAEKRCPDGYLEDLLSDKISFDNDLQLPSIFNTRSIHSVSAIDQSPPSPGSRKSSANSTPRSETETSGSSVLVNMIQDYVKMVMDVSLALSQPAQTEAPEGSVSGFSPVSNVFEKEGESATMYTSQTEIENVGVENTFDSRSWGEKQIAVQRDNLVKSEGKDHDDKSSDEQSLMEVRHTEQIRNVATTNETNEIDGKDENSDFHLKLGPIGPRKSSVEKWESATLRAEKLISEEEVETLSNKHETDAERMIESGSIQTCSSTKAVPNDEHMITTSPISQHASELNCNPSSEFFEDATVKKVGLNANKTLEYSETVPLSEKHISKPDAEIIKLSETEDSLQHHSSPSLSTECQTFHERDHLSSDSKLDFDEHCGTDKTYSDTSIHEDPSSTFEVIETNYFRFEVSEEGPHIVFYRNEESLEQEPKGTHETSNCHEEVTEANFPQDEVESTAFSLVKHPEDHTEEIGKIESENSCRSPIAITMDRESSVHVSTIQREPADGVESSADNSLEAVEEVLESAYRSGHMQSRASTAENSISFATSLPITRNFDTGFENSSTMDSDFDTTRCSCDQTEERSEVNFTQDENALSAVNFEMDSNTRPIFLPSSIDDNFPDVHDGQLNLQKDQGAPSEQLPPTPSQLKQVLWGEDAVHSLNAQDQKTHEECPTANSNEPAHEFNASLERENTVLTVLNEMMKQLESGDDFEENEIPLSVHQESALEKDLRSYLESVLKRVSDQFLEGPSDSSSENDAVHANTDFCENQNPLSTPFQHLPDTIMTESPDRNDSGIFSENIFWTGNDQETDAEITGTLNAMLPSVFPESEQITSVDGREFNERNQESDVQGEVEEDGKRSVADEEEPIGTAGQLLDDVDDWDIVDVLEQCIDVLNTLEYLTQTVSSNTEDTTLDSVTEDGVFSGTTSDSDTRRSGDASDVERETGAIFESTTNDDPSKTNPIGINSKNQHCIPVIFEDLFAFIQEQDAFQEENITGEEEARQSNIGKPQFSEMNSEILSESAGTEDIVDAIISVVCVVEVVEAMMEDVVKLLGTVSSSAGNGLKDQSRVASPAKVEDLQTESPNQKKSNSLAFEREDWSEEEFHVTEGKEQVPGSVQNCVASIVSVVEVVEILLGAASFTDSESQSDESQHQFELAPNAPVKEDEDVSNDTNSSETGKKAEATLEMGSSESVSKCEVDSICLNPVEPRLLELQKSQQQTEGESEQATFTLDQVLSVVEVVQELLNVVGLEAPDMFADSVIPMTVLLVPEDTPMNSKVVDVEEHVLEKTDACGNFILREGGNGKDDMVQVHIAEDVYQREQVVCFEPSPDSTVEEKQEDFREQESVQQTTKNGDTSCSLEPLVQNCEIFLNSVQRKADQEPEQEECSVITTKLAEVYELIEPSPNQSCTDEPHFGCEASEINISEGNSDEDSCQNQSSVSETMLPGRADICDKIFQAAGGEFITDYVKQLVDKQLFAAMIEASHSIVSRSCVSEVPGEFYQDHQFVHVGPKQQPIHFSAGDTSDTNSYDNIPSCQEISQCKGNCKDCFEEIADDNQNFEIAIPSSEQLHNLLSPTPETPAPYFQSETSETSDHEVLTETPILSSPLPNHAMADSTLSMEQAEILTASKSLVSEISDDGYDDDDRRSNNTWNITGTCQQLQLERARPTQPRQQLYDAIYPGLDLVPESSNCSLCVDMGDLVPTNSSQKLPLETSSPESSLKSLEQPTTSSVLEEVSHFLTTACVAALVYMSPPDSSSTPFNTDIIEDASKYICSKPREDGQS